MDFFLIKGGVVQNIAAFESLEMAQALCPTYTVVERTAQNAYLGDTPVDPGDAAP